VSGDAASGAAVGAAVDAALGGVVGAEHVERVDGGSAPAWRVHPGAPAEVAELVGVCAKHALAVVPVGSGSRPSPDSPRARVQVGMRRMTHVIHLDETSLVAHVQAGITGIELEQILVPRGLSIGDYPPVVLASTLGGIIAVRTPGKSSARHGFFEDAVLGVSAVLGDGRTIHTRVAPRRATGPDLMRALAGSEGTIGLITSVVVRLHRRPESRFVAAYVVPSMDKAIDAVFLALREEAQPSGVRIYDADEARVHFAEAQVAVALFPGEALLVAATAGPTDLAACDRNLFTSAVTAEGGRAFDTAVADIWWRRLHAGEPTPAPGPTLQVLAAPGKLRTVYHELRAAAVKAGGAARAYVSRFDANGAIIFVTLLRDGRPIASADDAVYRAVHAAAESAGGWLLGPRATRLDPYLAALRAAIDPHGIMNPDALTAAVPAERGERSAP
jgi:alkyldihydroxyacetonephosphate synthase